MPLRNTAARWGHVSQAFHWLIALGIAAMFGLAWYAAYLPNGLEKFQVLGLHKAIGTTIFGLALLRLVWRLAGGPTPPLPADVTGVRRIAAHGTHVGLYALLFAQPLIGIFGSQAAGFPVSVFDLFTVPKMIGADKALAELLFDIHDLCGTLFLVVLALHVGAALHHHVVKKDDVLTRMLPGRRKV